MKYIIFIFIFGIATMSIQAKYSLDESEPQKRNVIKVNALMNIKPDCYVVVFNVVQVAKTAESAKKIIDGRINRFKANLGKIDIGGSKIKTELIKFHPLYRYQNVSINVSETFNDKPIGFEIHKNVSIEYTNPELLDQIILFAMTNEIYDLIKIDYFIYDTEKVLTTLRNKCMQVVNDKKAEYAKAGISFDSSIQIVSEDFNTSYPGSKYVNHTSQARPSLDATHKRKKSRRHTKEIHSVRNLGVQAVYKKKKLQHYCIRQVVSKYFKPIAYSKYDVVINPVINEPVVQLSYSVTVKYVLPE